MAEKLALTSRRRSRRRATIVVGLLALLVCVGAGWVLRKPLLVEWHSRRLHSEDKAERLDAARRLVEIDSTGAVDAFVDWLEAASETTEGDPERRVSLRWGFPDADDGVGVYLALFTDRGSSGLGALLSRLEGQIERKVSTYLHRNAGRSETIHAALLGCLRHPDPHARLVAIRACATSTSPSYAAPLLQGAEGPLLECLADPDALIRRSAACALFPRFPGRLEVRNEVRRALTGQEEDLRVWAAVALGRPLVLGRCALPELVGALDDEDPAVRAAASKALAATGSEEALEALLERLPEANGAERAAFLDLAVDLSRDLSAIRDPESVVKTLIGFLEQPLLAGPRAPRQQAVRALGNLGPAAKPAAPALLRLLETESDPGWTVFWALTRLGPDSPVPVERLVSHLEAEIQEGNISGLELPVKSLASLGSRAEPAISLLLSLMESPQLHSTVRCAAASTLAAVAGHDPEMASRVVAQFLQKEGPLNHAFQGAVALRALGDWGGAAETLRPALESLLRDSELQAPVRGAAAEALGALATPDCTEETLGALLEAIAEPSTPHGVLSGVLQGLDAMGPLAVDAIPTLKEALREQRLMERYRIAMTIWRIDSGEAPLAVDILRRALADPRNAGRIHALAACVAEIGPQAADSAPSLVRLLGATPGFRRTGSPEAALRALGAPAVPSLVEALTADDIIVRVRSAETLGRIGPDAIDALPALTRALEDPDAEVRREARKALERIREEG